MYTLFIKSLYDVCTPNDLRSNGLAKPISRFFAFVVCNVLPCHGMQVVPRLLMIYKDSL